MVSSHNHTRIPCFISLTPPFLFPWSTYTLATFSPTHNHSIYDTMQSFPFKAHTHTAPISSLSPSTPTSHFLHQPHWDPNTVINNDFIKQNVIRISKIPTNCKLKRIPTFNYQELNSDFIWHYTLCWKLQRKRYQCKSSIMFLCINVCMHVFMYVCMYVCMLVCIYACMYVCCMYVCMYVCIYVCMYVCMYAFMNVCMYVCTMYVRMYACMYVCMYACRYVCMYAFK